MNSNISRLNKMLGDHPQVGWSPVQYGRQGQYAWKWAPALTHPMRIAVSRDIRQHESGLWMAIDEPIYEQVRQYPDDCWVLAKWVEPGSPHEWFARYGTELEYPVNGMYLVTDIALPPGEEPSEAWTVAAIGAIVEQRVRNYHDFLALSQRKVEATQRRAQSQVNDLVDSVCMEYDSIPGTRGGATSWGGI